MPTVKKTPPLCVWPPLNILDPEGSHWGRDEHVMLHKTQKELIKNARKWMQHEIQWKAKHLFPGSGCLVDNLGEQHHPIEIIRENLWKKGKAVTEKPSCSLGFGNRVAPPQEKMNTEKQ